MNILSFNTTGNIYSIALEYDKKVIIDDSVDLKKNGAELLAVKTNDLLKSVNISYKDLDLIVACTGPGSFTGIRISIAFAIGINIAQNTKVIGVSSAQALAYKFFKIEKENKKDFTVILDARREQVYQQSFSFDLKEKNEVELISYTNINKNNPIICDNKDLLEDHKKNDVTFANFSAEDVLQFAKNYPKKCSENIEPIYVRSPDAKKQSVF